MSSFAQKRPLTGPEVLPLFFVVAFFVVAFFVVGFAVVAFLVVAFAVVAGAFVDAAALATHLVRAPSFEHVSVAPVDASLSLLPTLLEGQI